ncbi:MAG: C1 family peptidase [Candidatus Wallbacteria bacterium]|nr:C1 family peptidase [Candidatus Wallbacteria bacterium]
MFKGIFFLFAMVILLAAQSMLSAASPETLLLIRNSLSFREALEICRQEGATYTIAEDAMPAPVDIGELCLPISTENIFQDRLLPLRAPENFRPLQAFDWRLRNGVTPIKNQGRVNCCWAFGVTGIFESCILLRMKQAVDISEQDLISCNQFGFTMNGGGDARAFYFFQQYGGALESDCPYTGLTAECRAGLRRPYRLGGVMPVNPDINSMKAAIYNYGPILTLAAVDKNFGYYNGGVFNHNCQDKLNHALNIVGWDDTKGSRGCWIIKNSWGTKWGEQGFMRIEYGKCRIGSGCVYVY